MSVPRFESLSPADFATVAALGETIWHQHYSAIISTAQIEYMLRGRYTAENLGKYVGAPDRALYLVREGDRAVGYFSYALCDAQEMKLEQLYLLADMRGKGVGKRMMQFVEDEARRCGCARVMLTVNKQNADSIAVYKKSGYRVREEAVFDIGNGYVMDDYVMEKLLT